MKSKFWEISLPSVAIGYFLLAGGAANAQSTNENVTTTTKTQGPAQVVNSYMVPTMMQTKETTTKDGDTIKETAPMIQERHEQVLVPQEETTTSTTLEKSAPVVTEEKEHISRSTTTASNCKPVHKKHVAYRPIQKKRVASASNLNYTRTKRTVQQPSVAHTEETVIDKSMIYERRDPALQSE